MSKKLQYTMVDGIKCYSPEVATDYADYPDTGFDLTEKNAASSFWVSSRNRLFTNIIQRYLVSSGKTKFLEIGCGTGDFLQQIAQAEHLDITGSEIYLKGLVYAKRNLSAVELVQFDVTQGVLGEQFDIVAAFDVIEHIEKDDVALSNINQMLNKGGVLMVSVPQYMFLWSRLDEIVKHKRRYSRKGLVAKLKNADFDIECVTSFLFTLFPLMLLSRLFDKATDKARSNDQALEKKVKFSGIVNAIFDCVMRVDEWLIKAGVSLPFGGTLVVVAKKR